MGLSHHEHFYYWKKISLLKRNEYYEILSRSMKTYSKTYNKINNISWLLKHTCVKKAYQDFVAKFLSAFGCVSPIRTLRVKSNAKPCFDTDVLNTFWNRDKHCKKFLIIRKIFDEKIAENKSNTQNYGELSNLLVCLLK